MFKTISDLARTPLRLKILTYFLRRPAERGGAPDVAAVLRVSRDAVQRELAALEHLGILRHKKSGRTKSYSADMRHPLAASFAHFVADALTPSDKAVAEIFRPVSGVQMVVSSGLLQGEPKSPVDLLIVAKHSSARMVAGAVKKVEVLSALPIRFAVLSAAEYHERRQAYDRLLRDVFEYKHAVVLERGLG